VRLGGPDHQALVQRTVRDGISRHRTRLGDGEGPRALWYSRMEKVLDRYRTEMVLNLLTDERYFNTYRVAV
jgi:hypothetical protein